MRLAELKKKGSLEDWREAPHLIITVGASLKRIEICQLAFPCVLPKMRYALLRNGEVTLATGPMCLAMQGVQRQERMEFVPLPQVVWNEATTLCRECVRSYCVRSCHPRSTVGFLR